MGMGMKRESSKSFKIIFSYSNFWKRFFDGLFSIILCVILFIPMLFIWVLVRITSSGPGMFSQVRYGKDSVPFLLYKFRTMQVDAPVIANKDFEDIDNYMTPIGNFLRRTSIDELPQLWNIMKGDMSFIGPRPLANTDLDVVQGRHKLGADLVRPGISGLAQVNGRNNISNGDKIKFDFAYAKEVTFLGDLKLILLTMYKVLKKENINKK